MSKRLSIYSLALLIGAIQAPAFAIDGKHINGRAVTVQWRSGNWAWQNPPGVCEGGSRMYKGAIHLYTIINGRVAKMDTLHSRSKGFAYFPAFNISATKVAFFRYGSAPGTGTSCVSVNGGKNTISAIDITGNNLIDLCQTPNNMDFAGDSWGGLDWPAGDWIYYTQPKTTTETNRAGNTEIWRVNYKTKVSEKVFQFSSMQNCGFIRRFQLNLVGDKMGIQAPFPYGDNCSGSSLNGVASFPGNSGGKGFAGCNASISASGNFSNNYIGSSHGTLYVQNISAGTEVQMSSAQLMTWFGDYMREQPSGVWRGDSFGGDGELVRWSVNSDKWVLQQLGWYGHADRIFEGSNAVAGNWVDQASIRISNNPMPPVEAGTLYQLNNVLYYGNEPGDLWIDGGAANAGKYENSAGTWVSVPLPSGYTCEYVPVPVTNAEGMPAFAANSHQLKASIEANGALRIDLPIAGQAAAQIINIQGKCLYSSMAATSLTLPSGALQSGIYVISEQQGKTAQTTKITINR